MVENGEKMVKFYFFLKNGEMVKNGDLNFKNFSHKYFISSLEYISMIVYTNVENHLFSSLIISIKYIIVEKIRVKSNTLCWACEKILLRL